MLANQNHVDFTKAQPKPTVPQINQPTTLGRANELINYVATLEGHTATLRSTLFGEGEPGLEPDIPTSLDGMLADACNRVASLCGQLATIKQKIGCSPE